MSSQFLSRATAAIQPYVPGEQPRDKKYIKINTNECPYPPSPKVGEAIAKARWEDLRLYPDPDNTAITKAFADCHGLPEDHVFVGGGSDEVLGFAILAFFDRGDPVCYADITYGFYQVYADLFGLKPIIVPLREDFTIVPEDYGDRAGGVFLANPNAPTAMALETGAIEEMLRQNPDRLVVVDEAYVDFAPGKSCVKLVERYDNLLVVQTCSKSRAMAGMRIGMAFGAPGLIDGLRRIKYSFNPFNLDRVSVAAGIAALEDDAYFRETVGKIMSTRDRVGARLLEMGFQVLPSETNFLFAKCPSLSGAALCGKLREEGILVRHFQKPRIADFIRVTVGTDGEMDEFLRAVGKWI